MITVITNGSSSANRCKIEVGDSLNKKLLFTRNYYDYEMCCSEREMSDPKKLTNSKAWCPLSFSLEQLSP